jgi:muramoyltetrapeptide carboxypeptidase LdcA involved in peptidoglycan recycling
LEVREAFIQDQRNAIIQAISEYAPKLPAIFGLDFGHTDPQLFVPNGGIAKIDGESKKITFEY